MKQQTNATEAVCKDRTIHSDTSQNSPEKDKEIDIEMTRSFLSDAISNLSSCVQVIDTKVSIIMAAITAIIAVIVAPGESSLANIYLKISSANYLRIPFIVLIVILFAGIIGVIVFGVLAISINSPKTRRDTAWYFSTKESRKNDKIEDKNGIERLKYNNIDYYINSITTMERNTIIMEMATELWKLNTINEKKGANYKRQLHWFAVSMAVFVLMSLVGIFT